MTGVTLAKPIAPIRLRPDGRCGCNACLADDARDEAAKDHALAALAYELRVTKVAS